MLLLPLGDSSSSAAFGGTDLDAARIQLRYVPSDKLEINVALAAALKASEPDDVTFKSRDGRILYKNDNYVFRQQYQATIDLPTFLDESPAAVQRLSRDFARALVADVLESF